MAVLIETLQGALDLFPAAAAALNLIAVLALRILDRFHARRRYLWIAAVGGGFLSWLLLFVSVIRLPHVLPWFIQPSPAATNVLPVFIYDSISWPYAFTLGTLTLAVLLTAPTRAGEGVPVFLAAELAVGAAGILAVAAATPQTLVLCWAFLDGLELFIQLSKTSTAANRRQALNAYALRSLAVLILLWQMADTQMGGMDLGMLDLAPEMGVYFLFAIVLRLVVYPFFIFPITAERLRQGLSTLLRMTNAASVLALLARLAGIGSTPLITGGLFLLAAGVAFYGALRWTQTQDDPRGRFFWFMSTAAFACAASLRGMPQASLAWGLALLLPGAIFSLFPSRDRRWLWLPYLSILSVSAIPFSPLWFGSALYDEADLLAGLPFPFNAAAGAGLVALFLAQAFLLAGYVRQVVGSRIHPEDRMMWHSLGDFSGNLIVVAVYFSLGGWMALSGLRGVWLPSAAVLLLTLLIVFFQTPAQTRLRLLRRSAAPQTDALVPLPDGSRSPVQPPAALTRFAESLRRFPYRSIMMGAVAWMPGFAAWAYRTAQRIFHGLSHMLEGQGGVLWALLLFLLLLSFVFRPPEAR